jgi:dolichol-phosphate mannosyltransferase
VIVPTFNERENVRELFERVAAALGAVDFELIFVDDDSPDGTAVAVGELAAIDRRARCLRRIGRRGLSSACIEGMLATPARYLAVIDADLQHDETLLPRMLGVLQGGDVDLVLGSRYLDSLEVEGWDRRRQSMSRFATLLANRMTGVEVADPMSGLFMVERGAFEACAHRLSGIGFKILLDILASSPRPLRVVELPYQFRSRNAGESKLDNRALQEFVLLLLDKCIGRWVPARFVLFTFVGGMGVIVHFAVLTTLLKGFDKPFILSQAVATVAAMTFNYALNNELTYRDRRLRGWRWLRGWASFSVACGLGALANVGIAAELFHAHTSWVLSALGGILVGAVWNYAVTAVYTWSAGPGRAE